MIARTAITNASSLYTALLGLLGLLCFLYPIRYVTRGSMSDVLQGVFMAFVVVGVVAYLIWVVARLLNTPPPPPRDDGRRRAVIAPRFRFP